MQVLRRHVREAESFRDDHRRRGRRGSIPLVYLCPPKGSKSPGLILQPAVPPDLGVDREIAEDLHLRIRPNVDLSALFGIVIRPGELSVRYPFQPGTRTAGARIRSWRSSTKPDSTATLAWESHREPAHVTGS